MAGEKALLGSKILIVFGRSFTYLWGAVRGEGTGLEEPSEAM